MADSRLLFGQAQRRFSRRRFFDGAGKALAAAAVGETLYPRTRRAKAAPAADNVVRILTVADSTPRDWTEFEKANGLKVEYKPLSDDVGVFLHEMIANDAGEDWDLVCCLSGGFEPLAEQGLILPIDTTKLKNWPGVSPLIRNATPVAPGKDNIWALPFILNADAFSYCWKDIGEPDAPAEVSWKILFDDKRTLGRVALYKAFYTIPYCAIYLKHNKLLDINDIANMTASECNSVADYLIERKKAGQFRTLFDSYDEQVQLLLSGEVLAGSFWEPVTRAGKAKGMNVAHAYTIEGYDKWAQALMIPAQVKDRGGADKVLATIDWIMGGAYAAEKSAFEGFLTPRPDLGLDYAREHGWSADKIAAIEETMAKVNTKFLKDLYWDPGYTKSLENYELAMGRFRA